ncbi:transglycosylase SLT domain-containing protein [Streptomyces albiaxialis]|uniref:aggregation-promoting factor C-terminal-like domain-containing protein n=1 Tax=Streptomyces albiaxialis TaxID=329523 RepID=UPI0031DE736C
MLEGNRVTARISVRGFAVASATAVTTVGAVVGVASGSDQGSSSNDVEATAAEATLLADIPADQQTQVQTASLNQQADTASNAAEAKAKRSAEEAARKQAAKDAAAKKEKAQKAAAKKKAEADAKKREKLETQAASRDSDRSDKGGGGGGDSDASFPSKSSYSTAEVQSMAKQIVGSGQYQCFSNIVDHESSWNYRATNASSGAYGLVQALPGSKMASAGADWRTNPATQIKWGLNYMNDRYGSPCGAWDFWQANNWY